MPIVLSCARCYNLTIEIRQSNKKGYLLEQIANSQFEIALTKKPVSIIQKKMKNVKETTL